MIVLALVSLVLQVAAAGWALLLLRRHGWSLGWLFFCLAAIVMLAWRVVRFSEVGTHTLAVPEGHLWTDTVMGLAVTVFFFLGVVSVGQLFDRLRGQQRTLAASERLAEEERQKLNKLVDLLPVGVVVESAEGIAFVNQTFCQLVGAESWALQRRALAELVVPEDRAKLQQDQGRSSDGAERAELRLIRADGRNLWVGARHHRGVWQGEPASFWVFADISERKQAEAERAATEALFSQGPVVLIRWRPAPARNVAYVSENIRAWGFDPERLMADPESFYKWAHPEDRERVFEEAQKHFASGADSWSQHYRLVCPDGRIRWILDRTVVLRDAQGQVVAFDGYLLDVTEAEESRRRLEVERERYAAALEATGEVVYDWNVNTGEITWNRAVLRAFGYTAEDMGDIHAWEARIHPEDRGRVGRLLQHAVESGEPFEAEYRFLRADGTYAHVLDRGAVEKGPNGRAVRMVGAMADLTQVKKLEEQLRLSQRLEALGQLAGGVAHDFNNLLTAILGTADLLERKLGPGTPAVQDVMAIREAAQRAAQLTRQLLAFARRQVIEPQYLDLNALVARSVEMLRRVLPETIRVEFIPGQRLGTVYADPGQMDQVLMNLAVNARDAMPEGGVLTIETENVLINGEYVREHPWAREGRYVLLSVSDTGVGMDRATLERALEPFFTTKEPGKGTGLGLATVYGIVKQHDGMIHLYSEPGKGTTVKIYLPIVERRAADVGPKVEGAVRGGTEAILLGEDEESVRQVLAEALSALGYRVVTAFDGADALEILEKENFGVDLVITDVVMPRMGGWELYERAHERAPDLLFLFSTGYSENAVHENFHKKPGIFLISKPYGLDSLARKVREVLDQKKEGKI